MMQYQQQRSPAPTPTRGLTLRRIKQVCFPVFIGIAVLVAFPAILVGFVIWWCSFFAWDRREYWRTTIAVAVFCVIGYVAWIWIADPLPWLVATLFTDIVRHLWQSGGEALGLFWLFHLWLAPATAPVLALLYPGRNSRRPFKRPIALKSPAPHEIEQEEQVLETTALVAFERMTATLPSSSSEQINLAGAAGTIVVPAAQQYEALGIYEGGELDDLVSGGELCLPPELLEVHGVVVGEPKFGKTFTLLRLAAIARSYGRKVVFLDLKGSRKTAALFLAAMSRLQVQRVKLYPLDAYDGWRGDPQALYNRLMEQIDPVTHPFYRSAVGSTVVSLAVKAPAGPPKNSYAFLERLDLAWLKIAYAGDAQALREIGSVKNHIAGLQLVMAGFFRGIAGGLDGTWAIDDVDACYIGINGVDHKEEAATFGRYILEDAANYATSRKDPKEQVLLIIDEFGVLRSTNATALYESVREAGMSVYSAGQSYQSLGRERDDVLAASAVKILHRTGNPEPIVRYAGEREQFLFSRMVGGVGDEEELLRPTANRPGDDGGQQTILRPQKELAIPVEEVQRLDVGRVAFISGGRGGYVQVHPLALPSVVIQAAVRYIANASTFQPLPLPPSPPQAPPANPQPPKGPKQANPAGGGPGATKKAGAAPKATPVLPPQNTQAAGPPRPGGKITKALSPTQLRQPLTGTQPKGKLQPDDEDFFQ